MKNLYPIIYSLLFSLSTIQANAYDWTYFAQVDTLGQSVQFFMWTPPTATHIRGIILGANIGALNRSSGVTNDSAIRAVCTAENLAIVGFINAPFVARFDSTQGDHLILLSGLSKLAKASFFPEVAYAPICSYGHSVGGEFASQIAYWRPNRIFAIINDNSISYGVNPYGLPATYIAGVPFVSSRGSVEEVSPPGGLWWATRDTVLAARAFGGLATQLVHAGCGHFPWTKFEASYLSLFIQTAAQLRIPTGKIATTGELTLNTIPESSGWLTDTTLTTNSIAMASFANYTGDVTNAFWHLSQPLAQLWVNLHAGNFQKNPQSLKFKATRYNNCQPQNAFSVCKILTLGGSVNDSLNLAATATSGLPVVYEYYNAPFRVNANQDSVFMDAAQTEYGNAGWVMATQAGNTTTQYTERVLYFTVNSKPGTAQTVSYTAIPDKPYNVAPFSYSATASSGLPVTARIICGAATLSGNTITPMPFSSGYSTVIIKYVQNGFPNYGTSAIKTDTFQIGPNVLLERTPVVQNVKLTIYPIPVESDVNILSSANDQLLYAELISVNGRVVWQSALSGTNQKVDLSSVTTGVFVLRIMTAKGIYLQKLVKK